MHEDFFFFTAAKQQMGRACAQINVAAVARLNVHLQANPLI